MGRSISCIRQRIAREEAERILEPVARDGTPLVETAIYYPYFWFLLRFSARTLLGKSALRVSCLIDARTRVGATADPFEIDMVEVSEVDVLSRSIPESEAESLARRYAGYVVRNRRKALVAPDSEILERAAVYKPFWIVRCPGREAPASRVLVDAVTGGVHVLPV